MNSVLVYILSGVLKLISQSEQGPHEINMDPPYDAKLQRRRGPVVMSSI